MGHNSRFSAGATVTLIPAQGHGRRFLGRKRHLLAALADVIESGGASGKYTQGPRVAALEELMEECWHVASAIAVNSGSSALRLACEALCLEAGREVLVPALTFISTAYAVSDAGLVPVFVDVDPQTLTLDPSAAQTAMTRKTIAMLPVHLHGQMADMSLCWIWPTPTASTSSRMPHRRMALRTPPPVALPGMRAAWGIWAVSP